MPILFTACSGRTGDTSQSAHPAPNSETAAGAVSAGRRILYVDSYHAEYEASIVRQGAARETLEAADIEMRVVYLDAKRKKLDDDLKAAALRAKRIIDSWQPDLVIAADDAASKYLVMPYFRNRDLPIVFMGVNWDAGPYGYPYRNVTGQVEIELVRELISELRKYAHGNRLGILCGNTLTDRKTVEYYKNIFEINFDRAMFVNTFEDWQCAYATLQNEVDILIVRNNAGISGWEDTFARSYVLDMTRIVTGTVVMHIVQYVLLGYAKIDYELGEYAAATALKILNGTPPNEIPISTNRKAKITLNMSLAKELGIKFPMEMIEKATFIEEQELP